MPNDDESDGGTVYANGYEGSVFSRIKGKQSGDYGTAETSAKWTKSNGNVDWAKWHFRWTYSDEVHQEDHGTAENNFSGNDVYIKTYYKQYMSGAIIPVYYDIYHRHQIWGKPNGSMGWHARAFTRRAGKSTEHPEVFIAVDPDY